MGLETPVTGVFVGERFIAYHTSKQITSTSTKRLSDSAREKRRKKNIHDVSLNKVAEDLSVQTNRTYHKTCVYIYIPSGYLT